MSTSQLIYKEKFVREYMEIINELYTNNQVSAVQYEVSFSNLLKYCLKAEQKLANDLKVTTTIVEGS